MKTCFRSVSQWMHHMFTGLITSFSPRMKCSYQIIMDFMELRVKKLSSKTTTRVSDTTSISDLPGKWCHTNNITHIFLIKYNFFNRIKWVTLDLKEGGLRCNPDNDSNTTQCLSSYVQNQLGCKIPTWELDGKLSSTQANHSITY